MRSAMVRHPGWSIECIPHQLQDTDDGWNCGPWSHAAFEIFVEYFRAGRFDGLADEFARKAELRPLNLIERRGRTAEKAAIAVNRAFVSEVRDEMRRALREADARGEMPFPPIENTRPLFFSEEWLKGGKGHGDALDVDA